MKHTCTGHGFVLNNTKMKKTVLTENEILIIWPSPKRIIFNKFCYVFG